MRIVFMGTPEFAVPSLDSLIKNGFDVVGVVTAPDRPAGRGQHLNESAVKQYAVKHGLLVLQPEKLKDPLFLEQLKQLKPDLQIVVAFRMLPEAVWNLPELGTFNLHASLLPKYRGAAPINWAIINGEKETGVTTFKLKHEIDTGNILFSSRVAIADTTTAGELHDTLMLKGADLMVKTVSEIRRSFTEHSELVFLPQDDTNACHAPKIYKETCRIDWSRSAAEINNLIRGLSPYPAAITYIQTNKQKEPLLLKIYEARVFTGEHLHANGSVITDSKTFIKVYCRDGWLEIADLQVQGKKRMQVQEFLRGFKIEENTLLI